MTDEKFGRYQIIKEIGRGGMATVYHATDPTFEREVAIKVLPHEFLHNPQFRARFEREAKTVASLEHAAIVPVYDFGEEGGQPYIVMRFMSGGSLEDRLKKGALSPAEASQIIARLAPALDAAHARGIIHRDLKPGNILFDNYGDAFLSDFGIARLTQEGIATLTGSAIIGTPAYMSPEQIQGDKAIDGRSDIYAFGIIFFQMLTGKMPYDANTPAKVMMMHLMQPIPQISEIKGDISTTFGPVVEKSMAKDPDQRFSTASEMAKAVQTAVHGVKPAVSPEATIVSAPAPEVKAPTTPPEVKPSPAAVQPTPLKVEAKPTPVPQTFAYAPQPVEDFQGRDMDATIADTSTPVSYSDRATVAAAPAETVAVVPPSRPGTELELVGVTAAPKAKPTKKPPTWVWAVVGLVAFCLVGGALAGGIYAFSKGIFGGVVASTLPTFSPEPTQPLALEPTENKLPPTWTPEPTKAEIIPTLTPAPEVPAGIPQGMSGSIELWHTYTQGEPRELALTDLTDKLHLANPDLNITVVSYPDLDQIQIKDEYLAKIASGEGPDIIIANSRFLIGTASEGHILSLEGWLPPSEMQNYSKLALDAMYVDGQMYGVPLTTGAVGLYFHRDKFNFPPVTTDEMITMLEAGHKLVVSRNIYFYYGFFGAFGGTLLDSNGRCIADQTGFIDGMYYLTQLQKAGAVFEPDYNRASEMFRTGEADMIINGPWALPDYKNALKTNLGVFPLPGSANYMAVPLVGVDGIYINPNSKDAKMDVMIALYLTSVESQKFLAQNGGFAPVRYDIPELDPFAEAFAKYADSGIYPDTNPFFVAFWGPFNGAFEAVLNGTSDAKTAVSNACAEMNKINGK